MDKIASPLELQAELRSLLAYASSTNPSREKIATTLASLADRLSDTLDRKRIQTALSLVHYHEKAVGRVKATAEAIGTALLNMGEAQILLNAVNVKPSDIDLDRIVGKNLIFRK
jgi:hypothetical protein